MIDTIANNVAQRIITKNNELPKEQQVMIDPASILLISNMVTGIINLIKKCRQENNLTDEQTVSYVNKPNASHRRMVRIAVRRELGFFKNLFVGHRYRSALLAEGNSLSKEQISEALNEQMN